MNCIIIEDQPPAQRILKKYIKDFGSLELKAVFSDAIQAMEFLKKEEIDLIFLDIHLPKISGIDFLKTFPNPPEVILTTAFTEYALESYEFNVVDYLLKPFSFQRFVKAMSKVRQIEPTTSTSAKEDNKKEIFIKSGYEYIKIKTDDIIYIQSDADYTEIFLSEKKYISSESLRHWLESLQADKFIRIHKSFVINIAKIEKVVSNQVYLEGNKVVPIGRAFKENFTQRFLR